MKLLGFYGKKSSGKNTCGNFLIGSVMVNLGLCQKMRINELGQLLALYEDENGEEKETLIDPLSPNKNVQKFLEEHVWPWCKIYSFADPLKAICHQILGLTAEQVYGTQKDKNTLTEYRWENMPGFLTQKKKGRKSSTDTEEQTKAGQMTGREVLQYLGTEIFRRMNPDVWVNATLNRIQVEQPQFAIITDVRFPNEVEGIQKMGGKVIKLLRNPNTDGDQHPSEVVLDGKPDDYFDAVIDNTHSDIDRNNEQVKEILVEWGWANLVDGDGE